MTTKKQQYTMTQKGKHSPTYWEPKCCYIQVVPPLLLPVPNWQFSGSKLKTTHDKCPYTHRDSRAWAWLLGCACCWLAAQEKLEETVTANRKHCFQIRQFGCYCGALSQRLYFLLMKDVLKGVNPFLNPLPHPHKFMTADGHNLF